MRQSRNKIETMLTVFFELGRCCPSRVTPPVQKLIRGTTSMFFISWERQYDQNSCSYGQLVIGSFIMTTYLCTSRFVQFFLVKHQIAQVTQPHYSPDLVPCDFCLFPKLKLPLKGKRFQTINEIQENRTGQLGELCEVPRCLFWRGWRGLCPMYNISCIFNKCLYFSYYIAGYFLDRPHMVKV